MAARDPVLLIPGLMCDARLFGAQLVDLSRDRSVMVALPQAGPTVEEMSQAILDAAPARFAVVGLGLGAHVALDLMRRDIGRVTRVAFLSADPLGETPAAAAGREKRMILARTGRLLQAMAEELPPAGHMGADTADIVDDMALSLGEDLFVTQSRALQRRRDQQKTLRRATMPALVLAGAQDRVVTPRRQAFMAELMPSARVQVIEGAGPLSPLDAPEAVTRALRAFLDPLLLL